MERCEPDVLCTYLANASHYVSLRDYRKAVQLYEQALVAHSTAAELYAVGKRTLRMGDLEGATTSFKSRIFQPRCLGQFSIPEFEGVLLLATECEC
jgi:hypothetical protein